MEHNFKTGRNIPKQIKGGFTNTMKKLSIVVLAMLFVVAMATSAFAASYNSGVTATTYFGNEMPAGTTMQDTLATTDAEKDNGIGNANNSGIGVGGAAMDQSVIKNAFTGPTIQATHGSYQNNTNSCASCHQTHTGAGEMLMFKDSIYTTCTACHDGTLGIYNVFTASTAGTFAGTQAGNASMHLATGAVEINAAPGGKSLGTSMKGAATWGEEFNCASCHAPHGSYSDRLLAYNPNGMQSQTKDATFDAINNDLGGKKLVNVTVYGASGAAIPDPALAMATDKVVLVDTKTNFAANANVKWVNSPAALNTAVVGDDTVAVLVYKDGSKWGIDHTPWLYGYEDRNNGTYWTQLKKTSTKNVYGNTTQNNTSQGKVFKPLTKGNTITDELNVPATKGGVYIFNKGYMYIKDAAVDALSGESLIDYKWMDISQAVVVKFTMSAPVTVGSLSYKTVDTNSYTASNAGSKLSAFCAGCHVDYMVSAGDADGNGDGNGTYTFAYRHNTSSGSYACLKCHFAHGTDITVMKDAMDKDLATLTVDMGSAAAAEAYLLDKNPSSALKRYTNMSVCWKCHTSSHAEQFLNGNDDFYNNLANRPRGF